MNIRAIIPGERAEKLGSGQTEENLPKPINLIDPTEWHGMPVPEREWIVRNMIPARTVSLLVGDGATGKTTLGLQLAVARALGRDWIGTIPEPGKTLFMSAEDDATEGTAVWTP
jgi:RecA-family ATPase